MEVNEEIKKNNRDRRKGKRSKKRSDNWWNNWRININKSPARKKYFLYAHINSPLLVQKWKRSNNKRTPIYLDEFFLQRMSKKGITKLNEMHAAAANCWSIARRGRVLWESKGFFARIWWSNVLTACFCVMDCNGYKGSLKMSRSIVQVWRHEIS